MLDRMKHHILFCAFGKNKIGNGPYIILRDYKISRFPVIHLTVICGRIFSIEFLF